MRQRARRGRSPAARRASNGSKSLAAVSSSPGASFPRSAANEIRARRRSTSARWTPSSGPASAFAASVSASSNAPASCFAWAAASARAARRAGSSVNTDERSRNAAAAANPPRACARAAERSSSAATSSSGIDVACARCQARRSGSIVRIGRSARARWTSLRSSARGCPVHRRTRQRMTEDDPGTQVQQAVRLQRSRRRLGDPEPLPPRATRAQRSPVGSAAASSNRRRPSGGTLASRRAKCSSIRADSGSAAGQTEPTRELRRRHAARQLQAARADSRASRRRCARALGHPREPAGRTPAGPAHRGVPGVRRRPRGSPPSVVAALAGREQQRDPLRQQPPGDERERPSRRIDPATARRRPRREGALLGRLRQQTEHREPDEERIRAPARHCSPNATASASRCGSGRRSRQLDDRCAQLLERGVRELHLPFDAGGAHDPEVLSASTASSSSAVLPTPGSPCSTKTPPCPARAPSSRRSSTSRSRCGRATAVPAAS